MHRGISGIVFPGPEEPDEVAELGRAHPQMEKEHGVEPGTTELVLMLESAKGFWNAVALAQASPRVTALGVGRIDLTMRLGPVPQGEFRLYRFLMTRALVAARMLGKQPLGAFWRPGSRGGVASKESTAKAAREGRLMGFTGCLCATPEQVAPVNEGFAQADHGSQQSGTQPCGERPMPSTYAARSSACRSTIRSSGRKRYASWADAIILDFARKPGRDWQEDLQVAHARGDTRGGRGGARSLRADRRSDARAAELESTVFPGIPASC